MFATLRLMKSFVDQFRPAADIRTLRIRARLLAAVRSLFSARGYWEVETPLLSRDVVVDAHLEPFAVDDDPKNTPRFLQTSPEFGMKRLLAAGADSIYQITRGFRRDEVGRLHNPEFTIVEWYRAGVTYHDQMSLVEEVVRHTLDAAVPEIPAGPDRRLPAHPFRRLSYDAAFKRAVGRPVLACATLELLELCRENSVAIPTGLQTGDRNALLNLLLSELVEPTLGEDAPEFLLDYPESQAALARIRDDDPPVAERFELYLRGIELCNGYQELTDAGELRQRISEQNAMRMQNGRRPLPAENRLLAAMDIGLPDCSGVALGFDRLVMLALGHDALEDVIAFPFDRA